VRIFVYCVSFDRVLCCVMCVVCVLCLIVVPLPPGENPFAVKMNIYLILYRLLLPILLCFILPSLLNLGPHNVFLLHRLYFKHPFVFILSPLSDSHIYSS
jgi:hypothetical protein